MVLAGEQWLALQHFCEDTSCTPDINLNIILLPGKHNLRGSVVSCRNISGHLGVLNTGKAKIADLEIAILVDENVARLEITMNDTCRVDILKTTIGEVSRVNQIGSFMCIPEFGRGSTE
jgi:hypothetical protein